LNNATKKQQHILQVNIIKINAVRRALNGSAQSQSGSKRI